MTPAFRIFMDLIDAIMIREQILYLSRVENGPYLDVCDVYIYLGFVHMPKPMSIN